VKTNEEKKRKNGPREKLGHGNEQAQEEECTTQLSHGLHVRREGSWIEGHASGV